MCLCIEVITIILWETINASVEGKFYIAISSDIQVNDLTKYCTLAHISKLWICTLG